jgi:hypothetical protein
MYLKEWLEYHTFIGVEKFYVYDNAESMQISDELPPESELPQKNKYGYNYSLTIDEAREIQNTIIKDYNVDLIHWSPKNSNGVVVYGWADSATHLSQIKKDGLVAFIDVDEFIVKQEEFYQSRIFQAKYDDRRHYKSVLDISNGFKVNTANWGTKCIIDMQKYSQPKSMHFPGLSLPISKSFFNHYNHNSVGHDWLLKNYLDFAPNWMPTKYEDVFVTMPTLRELSGFGDKVRR